MELLSPAPVGTDLVRVGGGGWRCDALQYAGCSEHNLARYAVHPGETAGSSWVPLFFEDGIKSGCQHLVRVVGISFHVLGAQSEMVFRGRSRSRHQYKPPNISGLVWSGMLSVFVWSIAARTPFSLSGCSQLFGSGHVLGEVYSLDATRRLVPHVDCCHVSCRDWWEG
ncbi:hypothetical protein TIFTF001_049705 [Ficus carica]|nr:hypothetical protein TIFTF001_049705 [Ficus carica]